LDRIELKAVSRAGRGNGPARALRREGQVPATLYGPGSEPQALAIVERDLDKIVKQGSLGRKIVNLDIDEGKATKLAMIKELQTNPVSKALLHVDLYEIAMDRKIKVHVPVVAVGKAKGVELGGILQVVRRELEVFCLPANIPQSITLDISDLGIGDSIHVNEIPTEGLFEIPHDQNFTVITINAPQREVVETEGEEEAESAESGSEGAKEG